MPPLRAEQNNSNEADESYIDEGQNDDDAEFLDHRPDHRTDLRREHAVDLPENEVAEDLATPKVVDKSVEPASQTPQQSPVNPLHHISEEDKLRQQLIDIQRLNEAFSSYHTAIQAVREKQKSLVTKVHQTKQLLDRYVSILGQTEHNARLLLDPNWEGAQADEARILEEKRREEQARREHEEARRREEAERERRETEAREAAVRSAASRGRGAPRGTRGRGAAPVVRGRTGIPPPGSRTTNGASPSSAATSGPARGRAKPTPSGLRAPTARRGVSRGAGATTRGT